MATYSGVALLSCSVDLVFILGTRYLYLGVLRLLTGLGMRQAYSSQTNVGCKIRKAVSEEYDVKFDVTCAVRSGKKNFC